MANREKVADDHWVLRVTNPDGDEMVYEFDIHPRAAMNHVSRQLLDGVRAAIQEGSMRAVRRSDADRFRDDTNPPTP